MKTVVFDLDGTLIETERDLIAAANACFAARGEGKPLDPEADAVVALNGGRALLALGASRIGADPEARAESDYPLFLNFYESALDTHTRVYPGVPEVLAELRRSGYRIGLCSNKPGWMVDALLTKFGLRELFDARIASDTLGTMKPDPAPYVAAVARAGGTLATSFMVGDTEIDRDTARAAGVPCVLVTYGPAGEGVSIFAPDHVLERIDDLPALTRSLIGVPQDGA